MNKFESSEIRVTVESPQEEKLEVTNERNYSKNVVQKQSRIIDCNKSGSSEFNEMSDEISNCEETSMINSLRPADLLWVPINFQDEPVNAMIDSGATFSFIKKSEVNRSSIAIENKAMSNVTGYGGAVIGTLGCVKLNFTMFGQSMNETFHIVDDDVLQWKVMLGMNFLVDNKVVLNLANKSVKMSVPDGSLILASLNDNDTTNIRIENVPVFATCAININCGFEEFVPIIASKVSLSSNKDFLFEGEFINDRAMSRTGIINMINEPHVLVKNVRSKGTVLIRKGERIGTISTIITIGNVDPVVESWDIEKLKKEIKLSDRLSSEHKDRVYEMLGKVTNSLSRGSDDIGKAKVTPHHIELTDYTPIWQKARSFAEPVNREIEQQCQELLESDIIEHSNSNWSSPCVPVRKPDKSLRLCIDYRNVNSVTKTEKFPMPNLNHCIYRANNACYFTKLDLVRGYYQVEIDEESRQYTAFSTTKNHFQFKRLAFGLKNSGIAFQRIMQHILLPLASNNLVIYIDDILIMNDSFEDHIVLVRKVLATLAKYDIKIKVEKCEFFQEEVSFLGHVLTKEGIQKAPEYFEKIKNFPRPLTITDLRRFLGLVNFQRKFIPHCSEIAKPLTEITGKPKRAKIEWTDLRLKAFNDLKAMVAKEITLTYPDYNDEAAELELFVDASNTGAGACLMQEQKGHYKPIGYASMTFSPTQMKYSTIDRELTAIRWGVKTFQPFVFGVKFVILTDHRPLTFMNNMAPHNARVQRIMEELSEYDFDIKYQPGKLNEAADCLSRLPVENNEIVCEDTEGIPQSLKILEKVEGGGDSMFEALIIAMKYVEDESLVPKSTLDLRKETITEMLNNCAKYKLMDNKTTKNKLKIMLNAGQLPCSEALLAVASLYNLEIRVYHDTNVPVVFRKEAKRDQRCKIVNLQCIASIHYNPLFMMQVSNDNPNELQQINCVDPSYGEVGDEIESDEEWQECELKGFDDETDSLDCGHSQRSMTVTLNYNGNNMCALVDTGAQVSLIDELTWNKIKIGNELIEQSTANLIGIGGAKAEVIGVVNLPIGIRENKETDIFPFAIVRNSSINCCLLLGLNFLENKMSIVDCCEQVISLSDRVGERVKLQLRYFQARNEQSCIMVGLEDSSSLEDDSLLSEPVDKIRVPLSIDEVCKMQSSNHAIRCLKHKVVNGVLPRYWTGKTLKQFKRSFNDLKIDKGVVRRKLGDCEPIVISFPFLVEVLSKVHNQLNHVGRHRLLAAVRSHFWHPALDKVARDLCASCAYCQKNKTNNQHEFPPILKVDARFPFNVVAIDLLQFPTSSTGNKVVLVAVDHYSKWLSAVPLKDKTAESVAIALRRNIIPALPRLPKHILSDNGREFKAQRVDEVLREFDIRHLYSSPYHPSSNGAVERINRTLKDTLKAIIEQPNMWDRALPKAIVNYNNSMHSQLKCSPSDMLMNRAHDLPHDIPVNKETVETWKTGHPNFAPFSLNCKVLKKVNKVGNLVSNKFKCNFEGPFLVTKVNCNGVSYEIFDNDSGKTIKAHHSQLRIWREIPAYIRRYITNDFEYTKVSDGEYVDSSLLMCGSISSSSDSFSSERDLTPDCKFKGRNKKFLKTSSDSSTTDVSSANNSLPPFNSSLNLVDGERKLSIQGKSAPSYGVEKSIAEELDLNSFRCSELVIENFYRGSTPNKSVVPNIDDFMKDLDIDTIFGELEQSLKEEENIANESDRIINSFIDVTTRDVDRSFLQSYTEEKDIDQELLHTSKISDDLITCNKTLIPGNASDNLLDEMKKLISESRRNISARRERCKDLRKSIWNYRDRTVSSMCTTVDSNQATIFADVTNNVTSIPIVNKPLQRVLRSQGVVPDYPNVQPNILEYKLKRMNEL